MTLKEAIPHNDLERMTREVQQPAATLLITADDGSERTVALRGRELRIGRARESDIVLPGADKGVSRTHAELRFEQGRHVIVDLQSQNGTWVNGERVQRAVVGADAEITIGLYRLRLNPGSSGPVDDLPLRRSLQDRRSDPDARPDPTDRAAALSVPDVAAGANQPQSRWFPKAALFIAGVTAGGLLLVLGGRMLGPGSPRTIPETFPSQGQPVAVPTVPPIASSPSEKPSPVPQPAPPPAAESGALVGSASGTSAAPPPGRSAAREAFEAGSKLDAAGDWIGALHKYDQARTLDRSVPGLDHAVGEVWEKMRVAGRQALNRAREYDAIGQSGEAFKEYDKAAQWLPPDDPNRDGARRRADELRTGGK